MWCCSALKGLIFTLGLRNRGLRILNQPSDHLCLDSLLWLDENLLWSYFYVCFVTVFRDLFKCLDSVLIPKSLVLIHTGHDWVSGVCVVLTIKRSDLIMHHQLSQFIKGHNTKGMGRVPFATKCWCNCPSSSFTAHKPERRVLVGQPQNKSLPALQFLCKSAPKRYTFFIKTPYLSHHSLEDKQDKNTCNTLTVLHSSHTSL